MRTFFALLIPLAALFAAEPAENLLKNGSFEGSQKYWYNNLNQNEQRVVKTDAAFGQYALQIDKGFVWSGAFKIAPGSKVRLSASVRAVGDNAHCHFFLVPNSREAGVEPFRQFWGKSGWGTKVESKQWTRVSWEIDIPKGDFQWRDNQWWDRKGWMLFPSGERVQIDGLSLTLDGGGKDTYVGNTPVEITTTATNLPGYQPTCNFIDPTKLVNLEAAISSIAASEQQVSVQWQILDYAGRRVFKELGTKAITLRGGQTTIVPLSVIPPAKGLMIARARVLSSDGTLIAASDQPLTVLAFPKAATKPNPAERFGGSLAVGQDHTTFLIPAMQQVGFAWTRWSPSTDWPTVQPDSAEQYQWPDAFIERLEKHGFSVNAVIFNGVPKWARGKTDTVPKDMEGWKADDPRWSDLSIETASDRFTKALITRYKDRSVEWEIANEPLWLKWDPALYTRFCERTYKLVKSIDPTAKVMLDGCYGIDQLHRDGFAKGLAQWSDVFTFHNYSASGFFSDGDQVRAMHAALTAAGKDTEIWFNEGWTHWPSSEDTAASSIFADRNAETVAHETVRCIAETFAGGMDKLILFHLAYAHQGRSWWDWGGDGTVLFDDVHQPTVGVPLFNVAIDQLGLSQHVASVTGTSTRFHVFNDQRNRRGVMVAWGDEAGTSVTIEATDLVQMDIVGNAEPLPAKGGKTVLAFPQANRPVYVYSAKNLDGGVLAKLVAGFEKPNVLLAEGVYGLPSDWMAAGQAGNPYVYKGKPVWRVGRIYPPDATVFANHRDFTDWVPADGKWTQFKESQGGNPAANLQGGLRLTTVGEWGGNNDYTKPSVLTFIPPGAGNYEITGTLRSERWTGGGNTFVTIIAVDRNAKSVRVLKDRIDTPDRQDVPLATEPFALKAGEELGLVYTVHGSHTGAGLTFGDLRVRLVTGRADQNAPKK